jgi:GTP cyclohydrolase IA
MPTTKGPEDGAPARPDRTRITHPEQPAPELEPFADKVKSILSALGEDAGREGLLRTPERVEKSLRWLTQGYRQTVAEVIGNAVFEEKHQSMIMVRDIELYSLCEHHLLPFFGRAHVAYIPDGKILGLSKVARIVDVFARRLQVQERLTDEIADAVMDTLRPTGVGVVIEASHLCMMMRGVQKQNSRTVTSALRGIFRDDSKTRGEFLRLAHAGRNFE